MEEDEVKFRNTNKTRACDNIIELAGLKGMVAHAESSEVNCETLNSRSE